MASQIPPGTGGVDPRQPSNREQRWRADLRAQRLGGAPEAPQDPRAQAMEMFRQWQTQQMQQPQGMEQQPGGFAPRPQAQPRGLFGNLVNRLRGAQGGPGAQGQGFGMGQALGNFASQFGQKPQAPELPQAPLGVSQPRVQGPALGRGVGSLGGGFDF